MLQCTGLTISRRGPPRVSGTLPVAECSPIDRGRLRVYADKLVTDSSSSIREKLPLFLCIYFAAKLIDQLSQHNRLNREWLVRDRMADRERAYIYFYTHGGPRRPVSSAVYRRLTENASRQYEESPESGPTDQAAHRDQQSVSNSSHGLVRSICDHYGVSAMSVEAHWRFLGRPASIRFRLRRAFMAQLPRGLRRRKLALCVPAAVYIERRCTCALPPGFAS